MSQIVLAPVLVRAAGVLPEGLYDVVGQDHSYIYPASAAQIPEVLGDVTSGNNDYTPAGYTGGLYPSGTGFDEASGLGVPLVSDEIYHGLAYGNPESTALEFAPDAFVLNGFSKYFAMTGWRLGYLVFPPQVLPAIMKSGGKPCRSA